MQLFHNGILIGDYIMDKYDKELKRLLDKEGLIIAWLHLLDAGIKVKRELELSNDIPFPIRTSVEMERTREKWQSHLKQTEQDILGMIAIIKKQAANE